MIARIIEENPYWTIVDMEDEQIKRGFRYQSFMVCKPLLYGTISVEYDGPESLEEDLRKLIDTDEVVNNKYYLPWLQRRLAALWNKSFGRWINIKPGKLPLVIT